MNKINQTACALIVCRSHAGANSIIKKLENLYPEKYVKASIGSDSIYGNFYILTVQKANKFPSMGEDIPQTTLLGNIAEIKEKYPALITILIQEETISDGNEPIANCECDQSGVDTILFDIIINGSRMKDQGDLAREINRHLDVILEMSELFPLPSQIDTINKKGYNLIADEYKEELRVTSSNFHTCSIDFFKAAISNYIKKGDKVLEIGPGQNWLVKTFDFPEMDYHSVDVSMNMLNYNLSKGKKKVVGSVRYTPFDDNYFDVVIGSLSDPYFFPSALMEIERILKKGGRFIFTTPSSKWSDHLREAHMNKTQFVRKDGLVSEVYSFTMTLGELENLLRVFGMESLEAAELPFTHREDEFISPALTVSAENQNIPLNELIVLNGGVFKK